MDYGLPKDLGECVSRDVDFLRQVGWEDFVKTRRKGGDLADLNNIKDHPARRLLCHYNN